MLLTRSCRTLAALALAAILASVVPGSAQTLPASEPSRHLGLIEQVLARITGWPQSLLVLWEANGSGLDPEDGVPITGDNGSGLDPNGATPNDDSGSSLDPNGRT